MAQKDLMRDFEVPTKEQWLEKIKKDLRGRDFDSLLSETPDGIPIQPVYTRSDAEPGHQPFRDNLKWDTVQEIRVKDLKQANKQALSELNKGATSLIFYLVGDENLSELLQDIHIEYIRLNFVVEKQVLTLATNLNRLIEERGLKAVEIAGSINYDPLGKLAYSGNWYTSEEEDFKTLAQLAAKTPGQMASHCLNVNHFANAGATLGQQLGIALAMAYEYLHRLQAKDCNGFWLNFAIASDYFGEIAKLRAFRRLWVQLQDELSLEGKQPCLYTESALRNKSMRDAYNNMIRTTTETMAAIIGGANEVSVKAFDLSYDEASPFGERIAKNQSAILQYESHLDAVKDIAKGSYFIEELSEKLAESGWEFFKAIEEEGGYVEALQSNWLQTQIEKSARAEQEAFDAGEQLLIGVNKYVKEDEQLQQLIKSAGFSEGPSAATVVRPLKPQRLSESLEGKV